MAVATRPKAQMFSLRTPLLSEGRSTRFVCRTDLMSVAIKVYAQGGENALHTHLAEDHTFVVLDGEATFYDQDSNATVVKKHQGIGLPRGAYYWFKSTGDRNLVLVRFGACLPGATGDSRVDPQGRSLPGDSVANKHIEGVPIPGQFFGD